MNPKIRSEHTDRLFNAMISLQNIEECYDFFEDLCTISEIKAMAQRLEVAKMLMDNHVYSDIVKETGASTATISRVSRCFKYGSDAYKKVLERIKKDEIK